MYVTILYRAAYLIVHPTVFSNGFLEGQSKDIDRGFPSDSIPTPTPRTTTICPTVILRMDPLTPERRKRNFKKTAVEVGSRESTVRETPKHLKPLLPTTHRRARYQSKQPRFKTVIGCDYTRYRSCNVRSPPYHENQFSNLTGDCNLEAALYFLYTGETSFAPFHPDPHHKNPAEARTGDWTVGRVPSPFAKSIYRLADRVTVLTVVFPPHSSIPV